MFLTSLRIVNFRSYENQELEFSPGINVITGYNGSGKTNLIEAVSVLSNLKSFRSASDSSMIKWNTDYYYCRGEVSDNSYNTFEIGFYSNREQVKRKIKIDNQEIKKVSDYYGKLVTVSFVPTDINILSGTPDIRRRYVDSVISKLYPDYINKLNRFREILNSRNMLLKKIREGFSDIRQMEVWTRLFTEKSAEIIKTREDFISEFKPVFSSSYKKISGENESLFLNYRPSIENNDVECIAKRLNDMIKSDIRRGTTLLGPQRDDFVFEKSDGKNFLSYASQGQRRTASISLKITEYEIIKKKTAKKSIILIDDIFSELDENRRSNMIDLLLEEGQIIFTMVDKNSLNISDNIQPRYFSIREGSIY